MGRFRVKEGIHRDLSGNVYKAGDIVESDADLDKSFRGKFERIEKKSRSKKKKRGAASKKRRESREVSLEDEDKGEE